MAAKTYVILVQIDDEDRTVTATLSVAGLVRKSQSYQTAWSTDPDETVTDPDDGHDIMTYDYRDEAIGELMTSIRDNFDDETKYR